MLKRTTYPKFPYYSFRNLNTHNRSRSPPKLSQTVHPGLQENWCCYRSNLSKHVVTRHIKLACLLPHLSGHKKLYCHHNCHMWTNDTENVLYYHRRHNKQTGPRQWKLQIATNVHFFIVYCHQIAVIASHTVAAKIVATHTHLTMPPKLSQHIICTRDSVRNSFLLQVQVSQHGKPGTRKTHIAIIIVSIWKSEKWKTCIVITAVTKCKLGTRSDNLHW